MHWLIEINFTLYADHRPSGCSYRMPYLLDGRLFVDQLYDYVALIEELIRFSKQNLVWRGFCLQQYVFFAWVLWYCKEKAWPVLPGLTRWTITVTFCNIFLCEFSECVARNSDPWPRENFMLWLKVEILTFLIIKWTRCTNFSNLFLKWNSTCFRQFLCPSSGVFHCTHSNGIYHTSYADNLLYEVYHCCVYSEKLLMMDRGTIRNM